MSYTPNFNNPYPNGWKDLPNETTPINASALQAYTDAIVADEQYLQSLDAMVLPPGGLNNQLLASDGNGGLKWFTFAPKISGNANGALVTIGELYEFASCSWKGNGYPIPSTTEGIILNSDYYKDADNSLAVAVLQNSKIPPTWSSHDAYAEIWMSTMSPLTLGDITPIASGTTALSLRDHSAYFIVLNCMESSSKDSVAIITDIENGTATRVSFDTYSNYQTVNNYYVTAENTQAETVISIADEPYPISYGFYVPIDFD